MTDHPITPPPELRRLWAREAQRISPHDPVEWMQYVSEKAAQWGADQELEACCEWLDREGWSGFSRQLRAARRLKSSLREEALAKTTALLDDPGRALLIEVREILELNRRALEALPDD